MPGAFYPLKEFSDVVVIQPGDDTQFSCLYFETFRRIKFFPRIQSDPKELVDHVLERLSGSTHLRVQLCRYVLIECECSPHMMMLTT